MSNLGLSSKSESFLPPQPGSEASEPLLWQKFPGGQATNIDVLTSDLLEHIFKFLPAEDVFSASHVNRDWRKSSLEPMQAACKSKGLHLPSVGMKNWWALQACALRISKRWKRSFLQEPPTHRLSSLCEDKAPYCFYNGCIQTTSYGVLVDGKERVVIELPPVGSHGPIQSTLLAKHAQKEWGHLGCIGLTSSKGYILYSDTIQLFLNNDDVSPLTTAKPSTYVLCAAVSETSLVTGHSDGVRLWKLPALEMQHHIATQKPIDQVGIYDNGSHFIAGTKFNAGETRIWKTSTWECLAIIDECDYFIPDNTRQCMLVYKHIDEYVASGSMMRYDNDGKWTRDIAVRPHLGVAFSEPHNTYIFSDACGWFYLVDNSANTVSEPLRLATDVWDCSIGGVGVSRDGRWVVVLLSVGDVLLWDMDT